MISSFYFSRNEYDKFTNRSDREYSRVSGHEDSYQILPCLHEIQRGRCDKTLS